MTEPKLTVEQLELLHAFKVEQVRFTGKLTRPSLSDKRDAALRALLADHAELTAERDALRAAAKIAIERCYPCGGTGRLLSDFYFEPESGRKSCGSCHELRAALKGTL